MYETSYHRATNVEDATKKLSGADDGKILAGGMTLLPTMKARLAAPTDLVDVTHISDMKGIKVDGKKVRIAAAATHFEVANDKALQKVCPAICELASHIGDPAVRHCGTIGGSVANNDPAADYPAAMVALDATIVTNKGSHKADDFFSGMFETKLSDDEIIVAVEFEAPDKAAYAKFPNPASRYAMAGVFVAQGGSGVRVGVTGASASGVFRAENIEKVLGQNWSPDAVDGCDQDEANMLADIHGTAAYRANLVKVMAKRAVQKT